MSSFDKKKKSKNFQFYCSSAEQTFAYFTNWCMQAKCNQGITKNFSYGERTTFSYA